MENIYPSKEKSHFIFCDDIRMEIGNKPSIMGWYSNNDILFSSQAERMITPFALAFVAVDGEGEFEAIFEIENPDGEVKIENDIGKVTKNKDRSMLLMNKYSAIEFSKEGVYKVRIKLDQHIYEEELKIDRAK